MSRKRLFLLSIPALRPQDCEAMPFLQSLFQTGEKAMLTPGFPAVTCTVQANMTTGVSPDEHGVIANGFFISPETFPEVSSGGSQMRFGPICPACHGKSLAPKASSPPWPEKSTPPRVEMWTAPNHCIQRPQLWETLARRQSGHRSAAWFPLHIKQAKAELICTPAPIHHPDGSESLWCYTHPDKLYGELIERLGHFPLKHYWGPLTDVKASRWIVEAALVAMERHPVDFYYLYLPHLDYAPQRNGPDSPEVATARTEIDDLLRRLVEGAREIFEEDPTWVVAGEYAITKTESAVYPNRLLREMGLLEVRGEADGEHLDLEKSKAWALCDHQCAHVYIQGGKPGILRKIRDRFATIDGIEHVLADQEAKKRFGVDHPRSGHLVLSATPDSWFAYYWWTSDDRAPAFARTVDIHRKPGYDPVELFLDPERKGIPLDADLVRGSHGAPARDASQKTVLLADTPSFLAPLETSAASREQGMLQCDDRDVHDLVLRFFEDNPAS